MSSRASMAPSAFSEDCKYYAQIENDGRCKIWETETNILKQEFTPDLHLSAPLSCLHWIQLDGGTSNPKWKSRKRKSSQNDDTELMDTTNVTQCIAFGTSSGKVLIYSLTHAKVESVMEAKKVSGHRSIVCMDWSRKNGLYTCSKDSAVREWNIEDGSSKTRLKMSGEESQGVRTTAIKVPNYQCENGMGPKLLVAAACEITVWSLDSGCLLRKMVGHTGKVCHLDVMTFPKEGRFYILSGSTSERILSFWCVTLSEDEMAISLDLDKSKKTKRKSLGATTEDGKSKLISEASCNFLMEDIARQVTCRAHSTEGSTISLAAVTRRGVIHFYQHTLNGMSTKPIKPDTTIQVVSEGKGQVEMIPAVCGLLSSEADTLMMGYSYGKGLLFERITPDISEKTQVLIRMDRDKKTTRSESAKMQTEDITKIRQADSKDKSVVYITSTIGEADGDSLKRPHSGKRVDVPMEMRLANLSLSQPGKQLQETQNMAQLLVQALHSKDSKLLQTVFECRDPTVAFNTLSRLPIQYIPALIQHLTTLMSKKTYHSLSACVWSSALCKARGASLLTQGAALRPLLGAARSRAPYLPHLLGLRARLHMLTERPKEDEEALKPTLEYKDSSSEDEAAEDDMDEALMNNVNDDSASWNEDDDEVEDDDDPDTDKEEGHSSKEDSDQDMSE